MELSIQQRTYSSYGSSDYLDLVRRILDLGDLSCGSAVRRIEVQVNFKSREHVLLMYDEKSNRCKENPDYTLRRLKKTLKIIYLSMVSTSEEEEAYFRGQPLDAEMFNELCYELRDYLARIEDYLEPAVDFQQSALLQYVDEKFSILPLSDADLNAMFEEYEEEMLQSSRAEYEAEKARQPGRGGVEGVPDYWDTSVLDDPGDSDGSSLSLEDVRWVYGDKKFEDFDEFVKALTLYSWEFSDGEGPIRDFELFGGNRVRVQFYGLGEGEKRCSDKEVELVGPGEKLSFLEFMFITNNELFAYLEETDHIFYEGFEELGDVDGVPVIRLIQGS
ncbi:MAG TPA: hypothetical protein PKC98_09325 [Candidatus Melainabacteria bacterium]|nr:hypothetical protein [Candidatus Melainabacteria bacterium]